MADSLDKSYLGAASLNAFRSISDKLLGTKSNLRNQTFGYSNLQPFYPAQECAGGRREEPAGHGARQRGDLAGGAGGTAAGHAAEPVDDGAVGGCARGGVSGGRGAVAGGQGDFWHALGAAQPPGHASPAARPGELPGLLATLDGVGARCVAGCAAGGERVCAAELSGESSENGLVVTMSDWKILPQPL